MPTDVTAGLLWDRLGATATFLTGAAFAVAAFVARVAWMVSRTFARRH
jgi:hypothetical protein